MRSSSICRYGVPLREKAEHPDVPPFDIAGAIRLRIKAISEEIELLEAERETLEKMIRASWGEP